MYNKHFSKRTGSSFLFERLIHLVFLGFLKEEQRVTGDLGPSLRKLSKEGNVWGEGINFIHVHETANGLHVAKIYGPC